MNLHLIGVVRSDLTPLHTMALKVFFSFLGARVSYGKGQVQHFVTEVTSLFQDKGTMHFFQAVPSHPGTQSLLILYIQCTIFSYDFLSHASCRLPYEWYYLLSLVFQTKVELSEELSSNVQKKLLKCKVINILALLCMHALSSTIQVTFRSLHNNSIPSSKFSLQFAGLMDGCVAM